MNNFCYISIYIVLFFYNSLLAKPALNRQTIAVIGDSYSTGLVLDQLEPSRQLTQNIQLSEATVWPASMEFTSPLLWLFKHFWVVLSSGILDQRQASWVSLLSKDMQSKSSDHKIQVLNTAVDGYGVSTAKQQLIRSVEHSNFLPSKLLVWFPLSEVCSSNITNSQTIADQRARWVDFFAAVEAQYRLPTMKVGRREGDSEVVIMPPLQLSQLMHDSSLLDKQNSPEADLNYSCKDLRDKNFKKAVTFPVKYFCPNLFTGRKESVSEVATYLQSSRQLLKELVQEWSTKLKQAHVSISYASELENFSFLPNDLSNDCLHFSKQGHAKLAKWIQEKSL